MHIAEKNRVRSMKEHYKSLDDPSCILASFDSEQVLCVPKTQRCEIFYRRRLAVYNFTVYNIKTKHCHSYVWHDCIAKRGSNEIASCVYKFLREVDWEGIKSVHLFCDFCSGQNRNTIIPAMILLFLSESRSVESVTVNYFEPHHGQNEGDSIHSCVERAMKKKPN